MNYVAKNKTVSFLSQITIFEKKTKMAPQSHLKIFEIPYLFENVNQNASLSIPGSLTDKIKSAVK